MCGQPEFLRQTHRFLVATLLMFSSWPCPEFLVGILGDGHGRLAEFLRTAAIKAAGMRDAAF